MPDHRPLEDKPGSGTAIGKLDDLDESAGSAGELIRLVVFALGGEWFALPLDSVSEISRVPPVTPVPGVEGFVVGLTNLRGNVLAVLDMKTLFGFPDEIEGPSSTQRMLTVSSASVSAAILVDRVEGVVTVDQEEIEPPLPGTSEAIRHWMTGHFRRDGRMVAILDAEIVQGLRERLEAAERAG